jgi:hypothetical protein
VGRESGARAALANAAAHLERGSSASRPASARRYDALTADSYRTVVAPDATRTLADDGGQQQDLR